MPRPDTASLAAPRSSLEPIEIASRDELAALQLKRLQWSLRHAYENSPHYRKAFDAAGAHPDDVKLLSDLARFPFTTKEDLRQNYPFGLFAVSREKIVRVHASSGTTGKPTVAGYTADDLKTWAGVIARSIRAAGGKPGMIVHNIAGYGLFTGGLGFHGGAEAMGCTVVPMSGGMTARQVQLIVDFKPELVHATPSYFLAMLDEFRAQNVDPRSTAIKVAMLGAEPWTNALRAEVEDAYGIHAIDLYGLSEIIGPGVACECIETKDGPHIWEDHFYPEIIDPESGAVLPDGELGELVFTSLTKVAMPVVRYRTRDMTRLLPGTARTMRRMEKITGRSDDMMIVRGVNVFPSQIEELILADARLSGHFLIERRRDGAMEKLTVRVEIKDASAGAAGCSHDLASRIKGVIGISATVDAVPPGTIERSAGKAKRVIDLREKT